MIQSLLRRKEDETVDVARVKRTIGGGLTARKDCSTSTWNTESVDSDLGTYPSHALVLDSSGNAHMSYKGGGNLKYGHYTNHGKHITSVDAGCISDYRSIALDDSGHPHISYISHWDIGLKYAHWNGTEWVVEKVEGDLGYAPGHTALAVDKGGVPHIAYYSYKGYELRYAYKGAGGGWITETLDSDVGGLGGHTSMTLDRQGDVHCTYFAVTDRAVHHAYHVGGTAGAWHIETIEGGLGYFGGHTSFALDDQDYGHASYCDDADKCVKYTWQGADGWRPEVVECDIGSCGGHTGLALDSENHAQVSYYSGKSTREIKYAYRRSSSWRIQVVDTQPGAHATYTALDVDADDRPHLTCYGCDEGTLKYRRGAAEAVQAAFVGAPARGIAPLTVLLTNTSTGDYVYSLFDFGDTVTVTAETAVHVYTKAGSYTVTLTVRGPGGPETEVIPGYINVNEAFKVYLPGVLKNY